MNEFKVIIVGDAHVGKSAFIDRLKFNRFNKQYVYIPTLGAVVHPIRFDTTKGDVCFKMWDTAGQEIYSGLKEGYYVEADAAILMYDMRSDDTSYKKLNYLNKLIIKTCGNIPRYVVGCKSDIVPHGDINLTLPLLHCTISSLTGDVSDPINMVLRDLINGSLIIDPKSITN